MQTARTVGDVSSLSKTLSETLWTEAFAILASAAFGCLDSCPDSCLDSLYWQFLPRTLRVEFPGHSMRFGRTPTLSRRKAIDTIGPFVWRHSNAAKISISIIEKSELQRRSSTLLDQQSSRLRISYESAMNQL